jgi:hypothetical protein
MSAHMLVVRNDSPVEREALIGAYIRRLKRKLGRLDGYCGASAWQSCSRVDEVMLLIEFREDSLGDEALSRFSKDKLAIEETNLSDEPAEVVIFDLESRCGTCPADAPKGTYLSVSRRVAAPGYGDVLALELDRTFDYLAILPGYRGHMYGSHFALSDQVLGLVLWSSEESFKRSLPAGVHDGLKLYIKLL